MEKENEVTTYKETKSSHIIRIVVMIVLCVITMVDIIGLLVHLGNDKGPALYLDYGWDLKFNSQTYSGVDLRSFSFGETKRGDTVVLTRILEEDLPDRAELVIPIHYYDVNLYLDGELIFSADTDAYEKEQALGSGFYSVNLGSGCEGKELKLVLRAGENKAFSSLGSPEIWDADSFFQDYAASKALYLALSFFFIIVGISMLIMAVVLESRGTFSIADSTRFFSLSMLAIAFGIWIFTGMNLTEIFTPDITTKVKINYFAFYLIPVFFIGFHFESSRYKDERGVHRVKVRNITCGCLWLFGILFLAFVLILNKAFGTSVRAFLLVAHIYDVIVALILMSFRVWDIIRGYNKHMISTYATIVTGIAAITDLLRYNYYARFSPRGSAGFTMSVTYVVMIFFVLSLFFDYMSNAIMDARKEERIMLIRKLAYSDSLTGLNNRSSTERYFDTVDKSGDRYIVVQFDLNDLKKANDTYGHEEGDKYITLFSDTLKSMFDGKGYIARNGGDEFIYVLNPKSDADKQWLVDNLEKLNEVLKNTDTGHTGLVMSAAYGFYDSDEKSATGIRDGLRIADGRMYEMKKQMKAGR